MQCPIFNIMMCSSKALLSLKISRKRAARYIITEMCKHTSKCLYVSMFCRNIQTAVLYFGRLRFIAQDFWEQLKPICSFVCQYVFHSSA